MDSMADVKNTQDEVVLGEEGAASCEEADVGEGTPAEMTTVMLKNMPSRCRRATLIEAIHELGFEGTYDFLHHPMKRNNVQNYGYAVINFKEPDVAKSFLALLDGYQLKGTSGKRLTSSPAKEQGLEKNKLRFGSDDAAKDVSETTFAPTGLPARIAAAQRQAATQMQSLEKLHARDEDEEKEKGEDGDRSPSNTASTRATSEADSNVDNESSSSSEVQLPPMRRRPQPQMRLPRRTGPASYKIPRASSQAFHPRGHHHHAQAFPCAGAVIGFVPVMMPAPTVAVPYFCSYGFPEIDRSVYLNQQYDD
eukprot:TRINITY_DN2458_c0_g3_i1.p1 TRINITY_DN2458_c0_g3~~TRINITY_DN2458_c0_g3_i1.p1  ORF type:complete len:308 (+),score=65.52 TRINITY_DN2458_c0_g3_i1:76-999(+)